MSEATTFCPREMKPVPVWYCLGSIMQGRTPCPDNKEMVLEKDIVTKHICLSKELIKQVVKRF